MGDIRYMTKVKRCHTVTVSNEEILKVLDDNPVPIFNRMFKDIEKHDVIPVKILVSPEIEKRMRKTMFPDFYFSGHLWTAQIEVLENIDYIFIIGEESTDLDI